MTTDPSRNMTNTALHPSDFFYVSIVSASSMFYSRLMSNTKSNYPWTELLTLFE